MHTPETHHGLLEQNTCRWGRATSQQCSLYTAHITPSYTVVDGICSVEFAFLTNCLCESLVCQNWESTRAVVLKLDCASELPALGMKMCAMLDLPNQNLLGRSLGSCNFKEFKSQFCSLPKCEAIFLDSGCDRGLQETSPMKTEDNRHSICLGNYGFV